MIPGVLWYICFHIMPLYGISIAFFDYKIALGLKGSKFIGFEKFETLFQAAEFTRVLKNTLLISFLKLACGFPMPIILALSVNAVTKKYFRKTVQTISYMPHFLSWVIVFGICGVLFNGYTGVLEKLFYSLKIPYKDPTLTKGSFIAFLVLSSMWKGMGMSSIIYLAALSGIDPQLYEAARVDGASRARQLVSITIPSILPVCAIVLILSVGGLLSGDFEQVYLFQRGNPDLVDRSDIFETWTLRNGITAGRYSIAAAIGIFQSFVGAVLVFITNAISKKLGQGGIW